MADTYRTANLESGMPHVDGAIRKLTWEIQTAKASGSCALKVIHGYGSSGTGGRIRTEARKYMAALKKSGRIKDYIEGERFSIFDESTRKAFTFCSCLRKDSDLERHNNGITIIVL